MITKLEIKVIDGVAPVTLAEAVKIGDGTDRTVKQELDDLKNNTNSDNISDISYKIEEVKNRYPQCLNYKGVFDWDYLTGSWTAEKERLFDNCVKGDFWLNINTNKLMAMHCYLHYPNDVMYFDGVNVTPLKMPKSYYAPPKNRYDVCIVGGGAGGVSCAYALKDKGYNVILIEKLDMLGGTHIHGAIPKLLSNPITAPWFKEVAREGYEKGYITFGNQKEVGEGTTFEKLWRGGLYSAGTEYAQWGSEVLVSYYWTSMKYYNDLKNNIDIRLNTEFLNSNLDIINNKKINEIKVRDRINGNEYSIFSEYFIDCSADGVLCRSGKTEGTDFFIGTDGKSLYNESAYAENYVADRYSINTVEGGYRVIGDSHLPSDKLRDEDKTKWKEYDDITNKVNGGAISIPNEYHATISTSTGNAINPKIFIDKGNDYAHSLAYFRSKAHFKKLGRSDRYAEQCKMLGIRESYRIKCDRMLTQEDCETRATSLNIVDNHTIALSSWWVDIHNDISLQGNVNNSFLNGIPYESLIPSAFNNVLVGSRCFGASHIAQSSFRLTKTIMSIGYACGKAITQCVDSWLEDVRDINIDKLQSDVGITELMAEMETYYSV